MTSQELLPVAVLTSILFVVASLLRGWRTTIRLPFPPGPKPKFLLGNLFDIPSEQPWLTYTKWGKQYGDVVHLQVFGNHILILNSAKAATELLEKRAILYSDRPTIPMVPLSGAEWMLLLMQHGDRWREHKRIFHQYFRREAIPAYRPIQLRKIQDLLRGLLSAPEDFEAHLKTVAAAIIMATIYGHDIIQHTHDRFVSLAEEGGKRFNGSVLPGAFAVNTFPFLRHFPSWFPGCGFHRFAQGTAKILDKMKNAPFEFVRQNMRDGVGKSCVLSELLDHNDTQYGGSKEREEVIENVTGVAYAATAETTSAILVLFIMAMAIHPEVVRKAQNEIDTVVGAGVLPGFEHRSALPYCEAVLREVFRWKPIAPLGFPHATSDDDIYRGYFIPKGLVFFYRRVFQDIDIVLGTTVLPNIWAMVHDESIYPNPDQFNPERFLNADGQLNTDDRILGFGFGRRICIGRYAADAIVWATMVSVLSTFNISKAKDANGNTIEIEVAFLHGVVSHPKPFKCDITPRNDGARKLIENLTDV
ncbi:O-methylsterigmatocystin oxidoreductase [Mycena sanguinolenta]|uniref:O-methylsterigmatocystin oxidoreductase n=1 Tax=Mycena sanguinolenta TaxID=230812 RepID=A0A8H7CS91_9AGAR|nr:O-methylsterigmatocystin oxidoreductase [Mycena sanguinolenta]